MHQDSDFVVHIISELIVTLNSVENASTNHRASTVRNFFCDKVSSRNYNLKKSDESELVDASLITLKGRF